MEVLKNVISSYLGEKGISFKEAGSNQFQIQRCINCGDEKWHVYMNQDEGLWDCKKCQAKGNFNHYRQGLGDVPVDITSFSLGLDDHGAAPAPKERRQLDSNTAIQNAARLWALKPDFVTYLKEERKLTEDILRRFKVGATDTHITIPIYKDDILVNMRYRRDPRATEGDKYMAEKGCQSELFNGDILGKVQQVYVTEGEFDAMQLIQHGFENTVSITLGANGFPKHWIPQFETVKEIVLIYDNDEAGILGADAAAEKLGRERCVIVKLPKGEDDKKVDLSDYFVALKKTKTEFLAMVAEARKAVPSVENEVKHISEFNLEVRDRLIKGEHIGIPTGYGNLDAEMGGLREGRMIVLSGLTNSGKSSFATNICLNLAERQIPSFYFSLEMPPIDIVKKILMLKSKLSSTKLSTVPDPSDTLTQIDDTLAQFKDLPIYLYAGSGTVQFSLLEKTVKYAVEQHKMRVVFVDHLHYFAQNYNNLATETSKAVREIKMMAMKYGITVVLLAHLNRGGRTKTRTGLYIPSLADLKETSTIEQDADQVLFVCRDSENEERDEREKCFVKVAKNRDGRAGGTVSMTFSEEITTFIEMAQSVDYAAEYKAKAKADVAAQTEMLATDDIPFG